MRRGVRRDSDEQNLLIPEPVEGEQMLAAAKLRANRKHRSAG